MNKICLVGRLTKDIEIRYTASNVAVANFTLAVNRTFKNKDGNYEADFINCIAFKNGEEYLSKYARKGDRVAVSGSVQVRNYDAQDGSKRYVTEVITDNTEVLSDKKEIRSDEVEVPQNYKSNYEEANDVSIQLSDSDLPF
jgi:single-strand DNA-binding protein